MKYDYNIKPTHSSMVDDAKELATSIAGYSLIILFVGIGLAML